VASCQSRPQLHCVWSCNKPPPHHRPHSQPHTGTLAASSLSTSATCCCQASQTSSPASFQAISCLVCWYGILCYNELVIPSKKVGSTQPSQCRGHHGPSIPPGIIRRVTCRSMYIHTISHRAHPTDSRIMPVCTLPIKRNCTSIRSAQQAIRAT